jgi:hypothetical protein
MFGRKPKNNSIEKKMIECPENDKKISWEGLKI